MYIIKKKLLFICQLLFVIALLYSPSIFSNNQYKLSCKKPNSNFLWNVNEANIVNITKQISKLTCENYIISKHISSNEKISIILNTPINVNTAEALFVNILSTYELVRIKKNNFYKIIHNDFNILELHNNTNTLKKNTIIIKNNNRINKKYIYLIYAPKYINIESLYNVVKTLISNHGKVSYINQNCIIIYDQVQHINLILKSLYVIDKSKNDHYLYIKTQHVEGKYIKKIIQKLYKIGILNKYIQYKNLSFLFNIHNSNIKNKYNGTNKIILYFNKNICFIKGNCAFLNKIKRIIIKIDNNKILFHNKIKIYNIYNGNAKNIANILHNLLNYDFFINYKKKIYISVHEKNNAIIICSTQNSLNVLGKFIKSIDLPKKQIYIKAYIFDVSVTSSLEQYWNFSKAFTFNNNSIKNNAMSFFVANSNAQQLIKKIKPQKKYFITERSSNKNKFKLLYDLLGNFGFFIPYLKLSNNIKIHNLTNVLKSHETYSDINIIASPALTTTNHEKAEIIVGEKIPVIGTIANKGLNGDNNAVSIPHIKYEDITLKFSVIPHIKKNKKNIHRNRTRK